MSYVSGEIYTIQRFVPFLQLYVVTVTLPSQGNTS